MASFGYASAAYHDAGMPDPGTVPEAYEGVLWRRTLAYFVDLCFIGVLALLFWIVFALLWVLSFGLLGPVLWFLFGLIPLAYHTLLLSGPGRRPWECGYLVSSSARLPGTVRGSCRHWRKLRCFISPSARPAR